MKRVLTERIAFGIDRRLPKPGFVQGYAPGVHDGGPNSG